MIRLINYVAGITRRWGICANVGATAGMLAGFFLFILYTMYNGAPVSTSSEGLKMTLVLTLTCWVFAMFYMVLIGRIRFASVALPALINIFLTVFLTLYICMQSNLWPIAVLIGFVVGILVGSILCRINNLINE